jgi:hypothetical protein
VIGLPEGELGASAADADGIAGVVVFAAHSLLQNTGLARGWFASDILAPRHKA